MNDILGTARSYSKVIGPSSNLVTVSIKWDQRLFLEMSLFTWQRIDNKKEVTVASNFCLICLMTGPQLKQIKRTQTLASIFESKDRLEFFETILVKFFCVSLVQGWNKLNQTKNMILLRFWCQADITFWTPALIPASQKTKLSSRLPLNWNELRLELKSLGPELKNYSYDKNL